MQRGCRKDVERIFGSLQARFAIIANPSRLWSQQDMGLVMKTCIILNNLIVKDERDLRLVDLYEPSTATITPVQGAGGTFDDFIGCFRSIRDQNTHQQLCADLIQHLWDLKGEN